MTMLKKWGYKRLGSKRGLTLIELLIVLVILAILAGVIVMAVGGVFGQTEEQAYNAVRDELQLAAVAYMANASHDVDDLQNFGNDTLAACCLLGSVADGLLREIPDGMRADNCGNCSITASGCTGCDQPPASYTWLIDDFGNVRSICVTADCDAGGDGYQGTWP